MVRPFVVLFLDTECLACRLNIPRWEQLVGSPGQSDFFVVSRSDIQMTRGLLAGTMLAHETIWRVDREAVASLRIRVLPTTMVFDPQRETLHRWEGALSSRQARAIADILR